MTEARDTLFIAEKYMTNLGKEFENLRQKQLTDDKAQGYIQVLLPYEDDSTSIQKKNARRLRVDLRQHYFDAPDLKDVGNNVYRFVNAVSDFATHVDPIRRTKNYKENLFSGTVAGNPLIDYSAWSSKKKVSVSLEGYMEERVMPDKNLA